MSSRRSQAGWEAPELEWMIPFLLQIRLEINQRAARSNRVAFNIPRRTSLN